MAQGDDRIDASRPARGRGEGIYDTASRTVSLSLLELSVFSRTSVTRTVQRGEGRFLIQALGHGAAHQSAVSFWFGNDSNVTNQWQPRESGSPR